MSVDPYIRKSENRNTYMCLGQQTSFLVTSEDTQGEYAIIEQIFRKGMEPPAHLHQREDETFYILEGEVIFRVNDRVIVATPGSYVFLPREVEHSYTVHTENAKVLIIVRPSGFEKFFKALSVPLPSVLPSIPDGPPGEDELQNLIATAAQYGIEFTGN